MNELVGRAGLAARDRSVCDDLHLGSRQSRILLLIAFLLFFYLSMLFVSFVATNFHIGFGFWQPLPIAIAMSIGIVSLAAVPAAAFAFVRFSFGYLVGFHLFAMMAGYFWVNAFGTLGYDRPAALLSAIASIVLFLAPALLITQPIALPFRLPQAAFELLPVAILALGAIVFASAALSEFHPVGLDEMYQYRGSLNHSRLFWYFAGNFNGALFPFAFACFLARKRWTMLLLLCAVELLSYPTTLSKISLFVAFLLVFIAVLSAYLEPRAVVILSLLIPAAVGSLAHLFDTPLTKQVFGFFGLRLLAVPALALEHYHVFFSEHPLTYFCQVSLLKGVMACPYSEQLGDVMSNWFRLGSMNASSFAVEGVASVGPLLAPVSALACGLVVALGNRLSAGLSAQFVLVSAAAIAPVFTNVSLTTMLGTNGLGLLFLLWALTPRSRLVAGCELHRRPTPAL
jgi:hypothetical protein